MQQLQSDGSYNELLPKADAWTKDETLSAQVASVLGLRNNYKPDNAFLGLYFGAGTYRYRVRVLFDDGKPCSGCTVSGLTQITGQSLVTDKNGYVLGKSTSTSVTIGVTIPYLDWKTPDRQSIVSTGIVTDVVFTLEKVTDMLTITSSRTAKISSYVKSVDIAYVGGGGNGKEGLAYENPNSRYAGSGANGRYRKGLALQNSCDISITIGGVSDVQSSNSSVKINGENINLNRAQTGNAAERGMNQAGKTGYHLFDEDSLMILGSSGGSGAVVQADYHYGQAQPGGVGAGAGGNANYTGSGGIYAEDGQDAINYGCGGGSGGATSNNSGSNVIIGNGGAGKQGAAFFRFYF